MNMHFIKKTQGYKSYDILISIICNNYHCNTYDK